MQLHLLAAGEAPPVWTVATARKAYTDVIAAATEVGNALNDCPAKVKLLEVSGRMSQTLAGLPKEDAAPETIKLEPICAGLVENLTAITGALIQTKAGIVADMQASVDRAVAGKVAAGELHTHADLCSKLDAARHETHAAMMEHMKCFAARRQAMATAKVPVPADEILFLKDEEFNPKLEKAKTRCAALEPYGVGADRLQTLAWLSDEPSFSVIVEELKAQAAKVNTPPNPFENSDHKGGAGATERTRFIGAGL